MASVSMSDLPRQRSQFLYFLAVVIMLLAVALRVLAVGPVLVSADAQVYVYAYPRHLSTLYIVHGL
jgi:hypothetical protein